MRLPALILLAGLALPMAAQDARFGLQLSADSAAGSTKHDTGITSGFGVGLIVPIGFEGGHRLRFRADHHQFNGSATAEHVGADYLYNFSGRTGQGMYMLLGASWVHLDASGDGYNGRQPSGSGASLGAGLGCDFNRHLGLELRYDTARPQLDAGYGVHLDTLSLGFNITF